MILRRSTTAHRTIISFTTRFEWNCALLLALSPHEWTYLASLRCYCHDFCARSLQLSSLLLQFCLCQKSKACCFRCANNQACDSVMTCTCGSSCQWWAILASAFSVFTKCLSNKRDWRCIRCWLPLCTAWLTCRIAPIDDSVGTVTFGIHISMHICHLLLSLSASIFTHSQSHTDTHSLSLVLVVVTVAKVSHTHSLILSQPLHQRNSRQRFLLLIV